MHCSSHGISQILVVVNHSPLNGAWTCMSIRVHCVPFNYVSPNCMHPAFGSGALWCQLQSRLLGLHTVCASRCESLAKPLSYMRKSMMG